MDLDEILSNFGLGSYQVTVCALMGLVLMYSNISPLSYAITASDLKYRWASNIFFHYFYYSTWLPTEQNNIVDSKNRTFFIKYRIKPYNFDTLKPHNFKNCRINKPHSDNFDPKKIDQQKRICICIINYLFSLFSYFIKKNYIFKYLKY
jgi:hypothetical protein